VMMAMMIPMFAMMASIFSLIILAVTDMDVIFEAILGVIGFELFFVMIGPAILLVIGSVLLVSGIKSLSSPE
ncbi:MAG: hypothetical protein KAR33_10520, partial [Candidatus Thorarchaeota archaeon]|nr:hypothetical protein [Candidatus Thorarchaeota archaeon]